MRVSRSKAGNINVNKKVTGGKVNIQGGQVVKADELKYLRSTIQNNRQCFSKQRINIKLTVYLYSAKCIYIYTLMIGLHRLTFITVKHLYSLWFTLAFQQHY